MAQSFYLVRGAELGQQCIANYFASPCLRSRCGVCNAYFTTSFCGGRRRPFAFCWQGGKEAELTYNHVAPPLPQIFIYSPPLSPGPIEWDLFSNFRIPDNELSFPSFSPVDYGSSATHHRLILEPQYFIPLFLKGHRRNQGAVSHTIVTRIFRDSSSGGTWEHHFGLISLLRNAG